MAGPATRVVATADVAPHADRSLWAALASGRRTWWTAGLLSLLVLTAALYDSFGGSRTVVVPVRAHRLQHQGLRGLPLAARDRCRRSWGAKTWPTRSGSGVLFTRRILLSG